MVVIAFGTFSIADKNKVDALVSNTPYLRVIWEYDAYKIDEEDGLSKMKNYFDLYKIGIIVHEDDAQQCHSYTLIDEITNYCLHGSPYPSFFSFIDSLDLNRFILAFANEWESDDLVRLEKIALKDVRKRLTSVYVWCEEYLNLQTNILSFEDSHPLILDIYRRDALR